MEQFIRLGEPSLDVTLYYMFKFEVATSKKKFVIYETSVAILTRFPLMDTDLQETCCAYVGAKR